MSWVVKIDEREPDDLKKLYGLITDKKYEITELTSADYALYFNDRPIVGIERKRVDDFFSSIKDNRLFHQCDLMIDIYDVNYLAFSKSIDDYIYNDRITMESVMGAIASVVVRRDINLIWFEEDDHFINCIDKIFTKVIEGKFNDIEIKRRKSNGFINSDYYNLIKIPFINNDMAEDMLEKYDDLEGLSKLSKDELMQFDGVGEKRSKELKEVLNKC